MVEEIKVNNEKLLIKSAERGNLETVKLLLDVGVDVHAQEDYSIFIAASNGHHEIVELLIKAGAVVEVDDNAPLYVAVSAGNKETVKILMDYGADIDVVANKIKNNWGEESVSYKYICELRNEIMKKDRGMER